MSDTPNTPCGRRWEGPHWNPDRDGNVYDHECERHAYVTIQTTPWDGAQEADLAAAALQEGEDGGR